MNILGISCFYHDAAACLLQDGRITAAASEERFTRKKHDASFPTQAIRYCLEEGGIQVSDLDYVGFYEKPLLKFERIITTYTATFPRSYRAFMKAVPLWLREKLWTKDLIARELNYKGEILFAEHHQSHAASTFLISPYQDAAILTVDGVGEWATASLAEGHGNEIRMLKQINYPHSLGLLYSAFTYFLGFKVNSAEYKVMGLAPYGEPRYYDHIMSELVRVQSDGSFWLNPKYFAYDYGLKMTNGRFEELFDCQPRQPESPLSQQHKDLAASVQKVTEDVMMRLVSTLHEQTQLDNLCLAGGVALNCVANGRILREGPFRNIFIQPAAGDAGGAIGIAAYIYHTLLGNPRYDGWRNAFLGPAYSGDEIESLLREVGAPYHKLERSELLAKVAQLIEEQNVIGWFQGRMEFGPRALGNRSILADPRQSENRDRVNLKIKFRESFRPFAPAVLEEHSASFFELDCPSPYMLLVAQVREDKRVIPSVTHIDGSARVQTVSREENPIFYDLIQEFYKLTGVPVLINTSFNVRGEPIVCTPQDAFRCFMRTDMDYLVMDNILLDKREMKPFDNNLDWMQEFELD
jgi:carbamoyltransferase